MSAPEPLSAIRIALEALCWLLCALVLVALGRGCFRW